MEAEIMRSWRRNRRWKGWGEKKGKKKTRNNKCGV